MSRRLDVERERRAPPPSADATEAPRVDRDGSAVGLRLAIGKDGLGIELARTVQVECLDVVELVVRLPRVRFPFDVTGGVARFRHKRGELVRASIELDERRLATWAEPRLRGLVSPTAQRVTVRLRPGSATVVVSARSEASDAIAGTRVPVLAFDVALVPVQDDLVLVVHGARGAHLGEPPTSLAIRAVAALVPGAKREGATFRVAHPAGVLARRLLPDAGVRAPDTGGVNLAASGGTAGVLVLAFAKDALAPAPTDDAARALEAAHLALPGDEARLRGDFTRARAEDLEALERAPRHPELARRIAEVDRAAGGRAEAAIATLRAGSGTPRLGLLLADLLVEQGDVTAAIASLLAEAEREEADALAAVLLARAAELATDDVDALAWLDRAIARAPRIPELRWDRARRRLALGRLDGARADVQELEALASGPRARHEVLRRAADLHRRASLGAEAARLYERALLYRPDDAEALAGLGAALAEEGRASRGAALLGHAIEVATNERRETAWMELALARVLGEKLSDLPAAIARVRAIPDTAPEAIDARGLEGRWRGELGDASGASLAFARLRERADGDRRAIPWLREAATFEAARGDKLAAHRHALAALALAPDDRELSALVRELAPMPVAAPIEPPPAPLEPPAPALPDLAGLEPTPGEDADPAALEARVEALTRTLQGDPTNDAVVDELVVLLTRLGRSMDLLALLSARLEDAPPERRAELLPRHREVLARLEADARAEGREVEADLFKLAREAS